MSFTNVVWPFSSRRSAKQIADLRAEDARDVAIIRKTNWSTDSDLALEEARHLAELENDRKLGAENKASIYLAVIAAVVPIALPLSTSLYADDFSKRPLAFQISALVLFLATTAYLMGSTWWAFRTFLVATHHRVDATEYAAIWSKEQIKSNLVSELFVATRLNRHMVNEKVTCVIFARSFVLRSLISFILFIVIIVLWQPAESLMKWILCILSTST